MIRGPSYNRAGPALTEPGPARLNDPVTGLRDDAVALISQSPGSVNVSRSASPPGGPSLSLSAASCHCRVNACKLDLVWDAACRFPSLLAVV
eukprot:719297-Hanusia_phi.AAC.1